VSAEELERFRLIVLADPALQAELRRWTDHDRFVSEVVRAATARGRELEASDVEDAMRTARQAWLERWI
jgi:hypothetical protein